MMRKLIFLSAIALMLFSCSKRYTGVVIEIRGDVYSLYYNDKLIVEGDSTTVFDAYYRNDL